MGVSGELRIGFDGEKEGAAEMPLQSSTVPVVRMF